MDTAKAVLRGKFIALHACIRKERMTNNETALETECQRDYDFKRTQGSHEWAENQVPV